MGSSALQLGKSGLLTYQKSLEILGANISNVSTTGYHNSRVEFSSLISRTIKGATGSSNVRGGVNPMQVGLGVKMSAIHKSFVNGSLTQSSEKTDFGIDGKGFFPISRLNSDGSVPDNGDWYFTRDGSMTVGIIEDPANQGQKKQVLVQKGTGYPLLGIPADATTNTVPAPVNDTYQPAQLTPIEIPSDSIFPPLQTSNVYVGGNLNASGSRATQPGKQQSQMFLSNGSPVTATTDLSLVYDNAGTALFNGLGASPEIKVGVDIGGKTYTGTFTYGVTGTTVADLGSFFESTFLNTAVTPIAGQEAASVQFLNNQLMITGNLGTISNLDNLTLTQNSQTRRVFNDVQSADGESTRFVATGYDSLGNLQKFEVSLVKADATTNDGQSWRWYATSTQNSTGQYHVGSGVLYFDNNGLYRNDTGNTVSIGLNNGAATPMAITMNFEKVANMADSKGSSATVTDTDGYPSGELSNWGVGLDGLIRGYYTNGQNREFGRIPIATMTNQDGLLSTGNNLYSQSNNTGNLTLRVAGTSIAGQLRQFVLEDSNVDLAVEMTKMIQAQRAFSSNSKVITTDQDMMDVAINMKR